MSTISFDTLAYAKKLTSAGFTMEQAEVQAEALKDIIEERLATKQDIKELEQKMKEMEMRMIIKLGAMIAASIAITVSLIKLIH